jgi:serine/threonine protein kinase
MERPSRPAGQLIGRYRIDGRDTSGITGEIYRATDTSLPEYSVSAIAMRVFADPDHAGANENEAASFVSAGDLLNRLRHPNVIRVYEHGVNNGLRYAITAHSEGRSLHRIMLDPVNRGPSQLTAIIEAVCRDIGAALAYLHACGITHRALNARNILVTPANRCLLANTGYADECNVIGWAEALAPLATPHDVIAGASFVPHAGGGDDLLDFGLLLFELAAGRPIDFDEPNEPTALYSELSEAGLPPHLSSVILRLLQQGPDDPIVSADQLLHALGAPTEPDAARGAIPDRGRGAVARAELAPPTRAWSGDGSPNATSRSPFRAPVMVMAAAIIAGFGGMVGYSLLDGPSRVQNSAAGAATPTATVLIPLSASDADMTRSAPRLPATVTPAPTATQTAEPTPTQAPATATTQPTDTPVPSPTITQTPTAAPTRRPRSTARPITATPGVIVEPTSTTAVIANDRPTASIGQSTEVINPPTATAPPIDE